MPDAGLDKPMKSVPTSGAASGLRILFNGTYPPPFGGIASHLKSLLPALLEAGAADIAVMTSDRVNRVDRIDGITVYRYNLKTSAHKLLNPLNWPVAWTAWRILRPYGLPRKRLLQEMLKAILTHSIAQSHRSGVISSYMANASVHLVPLDSYWRRQRKIVLTVFGEIYESPEFVFKHQDLVRRVIDLAHVVLASSRHCASSFSKIGVSRHIETVFYGVDLRDIGSSEQRARFRRDRGYTADNVLVFFMGRLVKDMGADVVIESAPRMLAANPAIRIVIAGASGECSPQAKSVAAKYPDRVVALENVSFDMQRTLYAAADVLVAPSYNQRACMGVSIKEAMAAALPVVAGAGGGVPEAVVDGETGYLIPVGADGRVDGEKFTSAVLQLVGDAELRKRFGTNGRRRAEELFSVETTNRRASAYFMEAWQSVGRSQPA